MYYYVLTLKGTKSLPYAFHHVIETKDSESLQGTADLLKNVGDTEKIESVLYRIRDNSGGALGGFQKFIKLLNE